MPDPFARLSAELRVLRRDSGEPSLRTMSKGSGVSHTTIGNLLNGASCPSWEVVSRVVEHLGGDQVRFKKLWVAVREEADPLPERPPDDEPLRPLMKLDRTDGPRTEVLWIYDPRLARQLLESFYPQEGEPDD